MELKDFVTNAFKQLIDGVIEAQTYADEKGASINPHFHGGGDSIRMALGDDNEIVQIIDFDIAVTVSENEQREGGGGLNIEVLKVGLKGGSEFSTNEVSRIKFSIPVMLPQGKRKPPRQVGTKNPW